MIIGIEASRANRPQKTGVEWYAYQVIQGMKALPEAHDHSWLLYGNASLTNGLEQGPENWHEVRLRWPPKYLWTQLRLSYEMWRRPPELLFVPAHVLPRVIPKRTVVTIHDVGFHRWPDLYPGFNRVPGITTSAPRRFFEWSTRDIIKRASRILTVSVFSKQEIVEAYGADPERIFVTPLGLDHTRYRRASPESCEPVLNRLRIITPFFLSVGRKEKKKNLETMVQAFERFKYARGMGDPFQLVLVGPSGIGAQELERRILASPARDFIQQIGYVSEEEKVALLSTASALIHASWYEGFGLPLLEAMACGCPVICSRVAALPEVVGEEQAWWFDPADPDALAHQMTRCLSDTQDRETRRAAGLNWVQRYRWEETARHTLDFLTRW